MIVQKIAAPDDDSDPNSTRQQNKRLKIYSCAHGCGYTADFDTVAEHEASCAKNVAMVTSKVDSHVPKADGLKSLEETKSRLLEDNQRVYHSVGAMKLRRLQTIFRIMGVDGIKKLGEAQTKVQKSEKDANKTD